MGQRKVWSEEEDRALKEILEERNIKKWSVVSKLMEKDFGITGRSGKQCRERWYNQLDPNINNKPWSEDEEIILFRNHDNFGNKWARIAQDLPGRTDNAIKNHFYSTLRKAVRRLNRFVAETKQKKQLRQIKPLILSKIIILSGDKVSGPTTASQQVIEKSVEIKQRLVAFAKECEQESLDQTKMRNLIEDIMVFNGSYKRRNYPVKKDNEDQVKVQQVKPPQPVFEPKVSFVPPKNKQHPKPETFLPPEPVFQRQEIHKPIFPPDRCLKPIRPIKLLSSSVQALLNNTNPGFPSYRKPMESQLPFFSFETFPPVAQCVATLETGAGDEYTYSTKNGNHLMEGQCSLESLSKKQ